MMFMDVIDRLTFLTDIRVKEVEEKQKVIEDRIEIVKKQLMELKMIYMRMMNLMNLKFHVHIAIMNLQQI